MASDFPVAAAAATAMTAAGNNTSSNSTTAMTPATTGGMASASTGGEIGPTSGSGSGNTAGDTGSRKPSGPPPAAFQNLPMSRGLAAGSAGGGVDGKNNGKKTMTLACPKPIVLPDPVISPDHRDGGAAPAGQKKENTSDAHMTDGTAEEGKKKKRKSNDGLMAIISPTAGGLVPKSFASPGAAGAAEDAQRKQKEQAAAGKEGPTSQQKTAAAPQNIDAKNGVDQEGEGNNKLDGGLKDRKEERKEEPGKIMNVSQIARPPRRNSAGYYSTDSEGEAPSAAPSIAYSEDTGDTGDKSGPYPLSSLTDSYDYSFSRTSSVVGDLSACSPATIAASDDGNNDGYDGNDQKMNFVAVNHVSGIKGGGRRADKDNAAITSNIRDLETSRGNGGVKKSSSGRAAPGRFRNTAKKERNRDSPPCLPYVTLEDVSDAELSSLQSDVSISISGDVSLDEDSLQSDLGAIDDGSEGGDEDGRSLGGAGDSAKASESAAAAAAEPLGSRRYSSNAKLSFGNNIHHERKYLHNSFTSNKNGHAKNYSHVATSRTRPVMRRRSSAGNNLKMHDSCSSLLRSSPSLGWPDSPGRFGRSSSVGSNGRGGSNCYADSCLFENLDRNWPVFSAFERMCLASFAIIFDGMGGGYPYDSYYGSLSSSLSSGSVGGSAGDLPTCDRSPQLDVTSEDNKSPSSVAIRERMPAIPIAVVHKLWSDVVLPTLSDAGGEFEAYGKKGKNGASSALEAIVRILANDLNYLAMVDINGILCLRLSHETYADYGHYIVEGYMQGDASQIEDIIREWHLRFAKVLKKVVLSEKTANVENDEVGLYAAVALPRHLVLSCEGIKDCRDFLSDPTFVARRMAVLGCRLGGVGVGACFSKIKVENIASDGVIRATQIHVADIKCVVDAENDEDSTQVAELSSAWQAACISVLDASRKKKEDPKVKERQQQRQKRRMSKSIKNGTAAAGSTDMEKDNNKNDNVVPESVSTTDTSESETANRHKGAPEEFINVSEDRKISRCRVRKNKKSGMGPKKVSFTFDTAGGPPVTFPKVGDYNYQSGDASTLTGSGVANPFAYAPRNGLHAGFADDATIGSAASAGIALRDVLNIDIEMTKREAAIGKSMYILSRSLRLAAGVDASHPDCPSFNTQSPVTVTARLQIKLLVQAIDLYSVSIRKLSFLLSDDLDMIDVDDLVDMLLFDTKFGEDANVTATKRLERLRADKKEARGLMEIVQLLSVEAWYFLGTYLLHASEVGVLSMRELADVKLLDRLAFLGTGFGESANRESDDIPIIDELDSVFGESATAVLSSGESYDAPNTSPQSVQTKAIACFRVAFSLLTPLVQSQADTSTVRINLYGEELKAAILHEFGLYQFEHRGDVENALRFFSESINARRCFLQEIQGNEDDGVGLARRRSLGHSGPSDARAASLSRGILSAAPIRSSALFSIRSERDLKITRSTTVNMNYILPSVSVLRSQIPLIEATLSSTIEYAALTEHSLANYKSSLAYFREAIILRATHVGKNSLDVASLQFNMGVVHDDFGEYEASINRYSESLRIRMQYLEQMLSESDADDSSLDSMSFQTNEDINELEITVILTLKCMGNVFQTVNEPEYALECYLSAIDTLNRNLVRFGSQATGLGQSHLVDGISSSIPLPEFVLDEMRSSTSTSSDGQGRSTMENSREALARNAANGRSCLDLNVKEMSEVDKILREMANMYSNVIKLIVLKKEKMELESGASVSGQLSSSAKVYNILSSNRSTYTSSRSLGNSSRGTYFWSRAASGEHNEDDDSVLLTAAYNLGKLYMHFHQYESSIEFLEHCLRTIWALNSSDGSTSDYSSDGDYDMSSLESSSNGRSSRRIRQKRRGQDPSSSRKKRRNAREMIEEGAVYHLMAKAHAALSDHERAVRCFVTGLRHYKRDSGSDDWKIAGALYDCGLSYWRIEEYNAAHKCWAECLVHLDDVTDATHRKGVLVGKTRLANVMYNLAASKCALGQYEDESTIQYLSSASSIYRNSYVEREGAPEAHQVGHCFFYLALVEYHHACRMRKRFFATTTAPPIHLDTEHVDDQEVMTSKPKGNSTAERSKDWGGRLKDALSHLNKAQKIYDSHLDVLDQSEIEANRFVNSDAAKKKDLWGIFHPMQAHISHLSGLIYDKLGSFDKATKEYASALRLSNILYGSSNVHSASLLHRMGVVFCAMEHHGTALKCYADSLAMRQAVLGLNNPATADTLFDLAGLHTSLDQYEAAIKAYDDCLKIRMRTEGLYGTGVVKCLSNTGIVHGRYGAYQRARDCLSGALKVSKDRVKQRKASFEVTNTSSSLDYASVSDFNNDESTQQKIHELAREKKEMASILHHIANVHFKLGETARALFCFEEALRIRRWLCGRSEGNSSMLELAHQDFEEASENDVELGYRQFYQNEASKSYNEEDLDVLADTLHSMGCVFEATKRLEHALRCYNEALIIKRRSSVYFASDAQIVLAGDARFGTSHPESLSYAKTLIRIGCVQSKLSNFEIALSHLEPGLRLQRRHLGRDHPNVAQTLSEMGRCLRQRSLTTGSTQGSSDAVALKCYNESLRISKLRYGPNHFVVAGVLYERGTILDRVGDYSEAAACYRQAVRVYGRQYAHNMCRNLLGVSLDASSRIQEKELGDDTFDPSDLFPFLPMNTKDGTTQREQYMRASAAFKQSMLRSRESNGASNTCSSSDDCWTWFELFAFQLLEFAGAQLIDPVRYAIRGTIHRAVTTMDKASVDAIVTARDTVSYNFLYMIQE